MLKMYVVVRGDMPPGKQAVQVAHAMADFAGSHALEFSKWNKGNNTLVVLSVENEQELQRLVVTARDGNFVHKAFYEPEWTEVSDRVSSGARDTMTAVAFAPNWTVQYILLVDLPLAMNDWVITTNKDESVTKLVAPPTKFWRR